MMNTSFNLQLFAQANTNTTVQTGEGQEISSVEMKTFYDTELIRNAEPLLIHDKFGQKKPIPKNGGKTIEFRKLNPFPKASTPLTEGITPDGRKLDWAKQTSTVNQYGDYVTISDLLDLTAVDNNILEATIILGDQAGRTLDTVTREIINAGTNVQYADGSRASRAALLSTDVMTVAAVKKAVTTLKKGLAKKIDGDYIAIIHSNVAYDLMNDPEWQGVKDYNPKDWYEGEIGRIFGCRFIESTEAKVFANAGGIAGSTFDVYSTLFIGADAYGITEVEGGGLQTIIKQLGSAGSGDPLNQRATVGWKAVKTAEILTQTFMVRVETASSLV